MDVLFSFLSLLKCHNWVRVLGFGVAFLLFSWDRSFSQSNFQKSINLSFDSGPLISNGTEWGNEIKDLVKYRAVDFQMGWRKRSNSVYNYLYRYPTFGIGYNTALYYQEEIGRPMALYGFIDIPFTLDRKSNRISFGYFSQLGLGFNLKPFDPDRNPTNQYIGSFLNSYIHIGGYTKIKINEKIDFKGSLGIKHFSNGATKKPNAGINLIPLNIGLTFKLGELYQTSDVIHEVPKKELQSFWNVSLYTGVKNYEVNEPSYFRGGFGVSYLLEPSYKYRIGLGMDMFWAQGMNHRLPGMEYGFKDQTSLAVVGTWEWQLTENLYVPIGLGVYLYHNPLNHEYNGFYERLGIRYRFSDQMFSGVQIKAHKARADFFEFTFGYTLPLGRN
jgi:hypothetical protein